MSNFEHAKYDADGVRIDDPSFNTQALRNDTSLVNGVTFPAANTVAINTNSVERLRVGNEGQTTILAASSSPALKVTQTGAGNAFVVEDSASTDATPFVIDNGGAVGVGGAPDYVGKAQKLLVTDGTYATIFAEGTSTTAIVSSQFSTNATGSSYQFRKSRGSVATPTVVADGDDLGAISFQGYDGGANRIAASILGEVDGTPGASDMPGRLVFSTTADGASSPTEALRIDSTQSVTNTAAGSGTNAYGFRVTSAKIGGTNNYAFSGEIAAGTNRWNFYSAGTANNAYAGNSSFGKVTAPTSAVDTTSFAVGFATNSGATCTVGSTDHTIVQTTTASTYTLPAASSFPGRILKILTQFAGAVVSASSNVVPIAGGSAGTAILAATAGKYAVLQSTGTNWQITEAN